MELLLITIPFILFLALLMYVLIRGVAALSLGLRTKKHNKTTEGIVILVFFAVSVVAMVSMVIHLWHKHNLEM